MANIRTLRQWVRFLVVGCALALVATSATSASAGTITGTFTRASDGTPIQGMSVQIVDSNGFQVAFSSSSNASGVYSVTVNAGTYWVKTSNNLGFVNQIFNSPSNATCNPCSVSGFTSINVTSVSSQTINFSMVVGGSITGTFTDPNGATINNVGVIAYDASSGTQISTSPPTGSNGVFTLGGLSTGNVVLKTYHNIPTDGTSIPATMIGFIDKVYPNIPCQGCDVKSGTPIAVTLGATVPGINFSMTPGGRIAGNIKNASTLANVQSVNVSVYNSLGTQVSGGFTNSTGNYFSAALPAGSYFVRTTFNSAGLINQLFENTNCSNCTVVSGTPVPVSVATPQPLAVANFALPVGGSITGTVRNAVGGAVLQNISVQLYSPSGSFISSTNTNSSGVYTLGGLSGGSYYVRTQNSQNFVDQVYNDAGNQTCLGCTVASLGSLVAVASPAGTTSGKDFSLAAGGGISGTVSNVPGQNGGAVISGVQVQVYSSSNSFVSSSNTNGSGVFTLGGLPTGNYFVRTSNSLGFINVVYDGATGATCLNCSPATSGSPIAVTTGSTTTGINLALTTGKTITGTVTSTATGTPAIAGASVNIYSASGSSVAFTQTNSSGLYSATGLPPGTYYAKTSNSQGFIDQLFDGKVCAGCSNTSGTPIDLTGPGTSATANFALTPGVRVTGVVTNAATGLPLPGTNVSIYSASGTFMTGGQSNDTGVYTTFGGVPLGTYYAQASVTGYVNQLFSGIQCNTSNCNVATGTPLVITAGPLKLDVNFAMTLGGRVTGTITDNSSLTTPPAGIEAVTVSVYDAISGAFVRSGTSTATGAFSVVGLPAGTYVARTSNSVGFIDELYDDTKCATCAANTGKSFAVVAGAATSGINFGLDRGGRISGRVATATGDLPIPFVNISVYDSLNRFVTSTSTNQNGVYATSGMAPGNYFVRTTFNSAGYINQLYAGLPCFGCNASTGTAVAVTGTATTANINFALSTGGSISGRVTDSAAPTPNVLSSISVSIYDSNNSFMGSASTNSLGVYTVLGLPSGTYFARTSNSRGYIDRLHSGIACTSCTVSSGTPIVVTAGSPTTGIDFALPTGGAITGTITDTGNANAPIGGVTVQVYAANGQFLQSTSSAANGVYRTTGGLPAGTYFVKTFNTLGFVDELYNDTTCLGCSPASGAPVTVTNAGTTSGIDFGLVSGGVIAGTITAAAGGAPVEGISLSVYTSSGFFVTSGYTNGLGVYKTGGMPAGSYFIRTSNSRGFIDQLYNAKACTNCNPTTGTPVVVATNQATTGINFSLSSGGRIRGTVTLDGGAPVPGMSVQIFSGSGTPVTSGFTDSQGVYVTYSGLPTGTYYARTSNNAGLIDEAFDNVPCTSCSVATTKPIAVTAGADSTGVNFALAAGGRIAGIVTNTATPAAPIANARVQVFSATGAFVASTNTGNSGRYLTSTGLPAGSYFVKVSAPGGLISALYKTQTVAPHNVNCPSCSVLTGTAVAVTTGATTNDIDFALSAGGLITGTVTDAATGVPLSGVNISIFDQTNGFVASASTDALGRYNSGSGMPTGTYFARTGNGQGYINQVYNNTACLNCLPSTGAPITVTTGQTTNGIDFGLMAGGKVSGTVTDVVTGLPIAGASVTVFGTNGKSVGGANTDNAGNFITGGGLPSGSYFARVSAGDQGYVSQVFANTTCLSCDVTRGTAITVTTGSTTGSINFALAVGGGVSGRVTSTESSAGIASVEVSLFTSQGTFVGKGTTNADGNFAGSGIPPGSYLLRTRNLQGFVDEAFDNVACAPCPMTATTATAISVTAKTTTSGINFGLATGGLVTGHVTNSVTGAPLEGVTVSFFQAGVFRGRSLPSDESGFYAISLPVGTYEVVPDPLQGYTIGVTPGSRTAAATTVTVTKGVETPSVSFPLSACTPPTVSPSTLAIFTAGQPYTQTLTASGGTAPYSFSVSSGSLPPGLTLNAATGVISGTPSVSGTASFSVSASDATGCAGTADFTPFVCGVSVGTSQASFTSAAAAGSLAIAANATDCAWTATSNASWLTLGGAAGTGSGTLGYTVAANPSPTAFRTGTITIAGNAVTVTQGAAATAAPFGSFDTPATTGTISGSVAVTGWALDDLAVDRVEIWRDRVAGETTPLYPGPGPGTGKIYIATPLFISGARPDVASAFASYPFANRAGWGYLMLTQGLWNQGNGTYTLYAFAFDAEGKSTTLGTKTITVDNANATKPFGGIDVPTYGQTVSGGFWNFGWGLTPGSTCTIVNGSVQVGIDSQPLTPVNYGDARTDIAAAFPGFTNGAGAGGAYYIDTTTLTDGAHQIGWYVVDNCARADGVGSRFFTVANGTASDTVPDGAALEAGLEAPKEGQMAARGIARVVDAAVTVQTDGGEAIELPPTADGLRVVQVRQGSRIAVHLPPANGVYTAYQVANGAQVAVPLGSSFDAASGTFYWEPAAGYLGSYDLAFVAVDGSAIPLRVVVEQ